MNEYYNLENFDWNIYLDKNPDLIKNNINTMEKAIIHFKTHGINEKRIINKKMIELWENYDWLKYKNNYTELEELNLREVFFHYYLIGQKKKYIIFKKEENFFLKNDENYDKYYNIYKNYDWDKYLYDYQDLQKAGIKSNLDCYNHYILHGIKEKRKIYLKNNIIDNNIIDNNIIDNNIIDNNIIDNNIKVNNIIDNNFNINNFDYEFFKIMNNHLKNIKTQKDAIDYLINNKNLDKIIYSTKQKELYDKYDWFTYINYYDDLKKNIFNEIDGFKHYINFGINENRKIFDINCLFDPVKNYKINYNILNYLCEDNYNKNIKFICNYNNTNKKIDFNILNNLTLFINKKNNNLNNLNNLNNNNYKFIEMNEINKFETIIKIILNNKNKNNILIITNPNANINYLKYHNKKIIDIIDNSYDFIDLSNVENEHNFYNLISIKNQIIEINNLNETNFNCTLITKNGINKILNNIKNLNEFKIGFYTKPYFDIELNNNYKNINKNNIKYYLDKKLYDCYYNITSYWNKIYCVNLYFDDDKRNKMLKYCYLLNSNPDNFFYEGILGKNLPSLNKLIDLNYYSSHSINKDLKIGTIGLNITQRNILKDAIDNNYNNILLLEDDISFNSNYFIILDKIFKKYTNIDVLYLGASIYEKYHNILMKNIDKIDGYYIYKPYKNLKQKICIGGLYAVILSKKAIKIFYDRFKVINNISDIYLCDIVFDIKKDFSDTIMTKTNYDLNTLFIQEDLFRVDLSTPSLTEDKNSKELSLLLDNSSIKYLSKTKKIQFLLKNNYKIKIYISDNIKKYYTRFIAILGNIINNYEICEKYDENIDICIICILDDFKFNMDSLNITISGENRNFNKLNDIGINSNYICSNKYDIYFPQLFLSLWERRNNFKIKINNKKNNFCAYMYENTVKYRVDILNLVKKYKHVDCIGKCCNNLNNSIDKNSRFLYDKNITYNDDAVIKYSHYKFVLALENKFEPGYVTEKIINPIIAGSIPIYAGHHGAFNFINKKRVIYVYDYPNLDDLINKIKEVDNNDVLYNSIIKEPIFNSNINFDNFEIYLEDELKKSLGLTKRNFLISKNNCNKKINGIDFIIKNFNLKYNLNNDNLKKYIRNFINIDDDLINFYKKINGISCILWINLERSLERRTYMKNLLENINIDNIRIDAVDGALINKNDTLKGLNLEKNMSNGEIGCTLSHIKSISSIKNLEGEYFMICEDDIAFDNLCYFDIDLNKIIEEAPNDFDILMINKIYEYELDNKYVKWLDHYNLGGKKEIYGTGCYIIHRRSIEKINKYVEYIDENHFNFKISEYNLFHVADIYIYRILNTYVYKYNFINLLDQTSTIQNNHLDFHIKASKKQLDIILKDF
jgi:GR25 family glycosyltransferase involved in LPS biosynthesis